MKSDPAEEAIAQIDVYLNPANPQYENAFTISKSVY